MRQLRSIKRSSTSGSDLEPQKKISKSSIANIDFLPDDFFYLLFKYMPQLELYRMFTVCPRFKAIGLHPMYWKTVEVDDRLSTEELCEYLQTINFRMKEVTIANRSDCDIVLKHVYKYNKSVTSLELRDCRGHPMKHFIKAEVIMGIFKKLPKLQKLRLKGISLKSTKFFEFVGQNDRYNEKPDEQLSISYIGRVTFKQLLAYANNAEDKSIITFSNGDRYTIKEIRELLRNLPFAPNSYVVLLTRHFLEFVRNPVLI